MKRRKSFLVSGDQGTHFRVNVEHQKEFIEVLEIKETSRLRFWGWFALVIVLFAISVASAVALSAILLTLLFAVMAMTALIPGFFIICKAKEIPRSEIDCEELWEFSRMKTQALRGNYWPGVKESAASPTVAEGCPDFDVEGHHLLHDQ